MEIGTQDKRTLKGIMADAGISQNSLADAIGMARSTLNRKINSGNFTAQEIKAICRFFNLTDPLLIREIFL